MFLSQVLSNRNERQYAELRSVLLCGSGKLRGANEQDVADSALGRELAAWGLTLRASIEYIPWLSMT